MTVAGAPAVGLTGMTARHDIVSRSDIDVLVRAFYRQVAMDDLLGPVFAAVPVDWSVHIPKLVDFWAWQLLGVAGYEGNPLLAHAPVHASTPFRPAHYERWLELFETTIDELFEGPVADLAVRRARKMAAALARLLDGAHGPGDAPTEPTLTTPPRSARWRDVRPDR